MRAGLLLEVFLLGCCLVAAETLFEVVLDLWDWPVSTKIAFCTFSVTNNGALRESQFTIML